MLDLISRQPKPVFGPGRTGANWASASGRDQVARGGGYGSIRRAELLNSIVLPACFPSVLGRRRSEHRGLGLQPAVGM